MFAGRFAPFGARTDGNNGAVTTPTTSSPSSPRHPDSGFDLAQVDRLLSTTRAVRKQLDLDRPVPRSVIEECLQLAIYAPNATNAQSWRWLVVTDPDLRAQVGTVYRDLLLPISTKLRDERLAAATPTGCAIRAVSCTSPSISARCPCSWCPASRAPSTSAPTSPR